jgi:hypothetical protein
MFYFLLKNPSTYRSLEKEIDDADAQGLLSEKISFAESNKMPYLLAACKETMRLHPSVGLGLPRYVPGGGREICGRFFPEGVSTLEFAFFSLRPSKLDGSVNNSSPDTCRDQCTRRASGRGHIRP